MLKRPFFIKSSRRSELCSVDNLITIQLVSCEYLWVEKEYYLQCSVVSDDYCKL